MAETVQEEASKEGERLGIVNALRRPLIRRLAESRGASRLAMTTVSYGTMVYLASEGGSQWQISLIAASTYLSAVLFGVQGGMLADSLSKRMAIASGYVAIALMYLVLPLIFGTTVGTLLFIMFFSSAIMQIVSHSLKSDVSLVSSPPDVAVVATSGTIASSIAAAAGSSFVAPMLIKFTNLTVLLVVSSILMLVGAWRTLQLPKTEQGMDLGDAVKSVNWRGNMFSLRRTAQWLNEHREIGATILVGCVAVAMYESFTTLIPIYVRDVLKSDPTNAVYIFAPAGVGFIVGMVLTPSLIDTMGARRLAVGSVFIMSVSMVMFGVIDAVAPIVAPVSPMRVLELVSSVHINDRVLAASFIAMPANFGSTAAGASVQAFINRTVPLERQGTTFGLQEVQDNVLTLALVILVGLISNAVGIRIVFVMAPILAFGLVLWLIGYSYKASGQGEISLVQAFKELINFRGM